MFKSPLRAGCSQGPRGLPSGDNGSAFSPASRPASLSDSQSRDRTRPFWGCDIALPACGPPGSAGPPAPAPGASSLSVNRSPVQKGWIVLGSTRGSERVWVEEAPTTETENSLNLLPKTTPCAGASPDAGQQSGPGIPAEGGDIGRPFWARKASAAPGRKRNGVFLKSSGKSR